MNALFDTHCHFDSLEDAKVQIPRAYANGVRGLNVIGCDLKTTQLSVEIVEYVNENRERLEVEDLKIGATMGLHPHEAKYLISQKSDLEKLFKEKINLFTGVGETGFDFYYNHSTQEEQTESFKWQLDLAKQNNKVLVIHTRDAWPQTFDFLEKYGWPKKVVLHCFTGGPLEAKKVVENGGYISISGIVTFKNAQPIRDAIKEVPLDNLLVETDAPWLAPVPYRGKPNEPSYVQYVLEQLIDIRQNECGEEKDLVRNALFNNASSLFEL